MITRNIYNSSGKIRGKITVDDKAITVELRNKPELKIFDKSILCECGKREFNEDIIVKLYDEYTLTISEIAAILDVHYCRCNKWIKLCNVTTKKCSGRRNSSYGAVFSESRRQKLSKSSTERIYRTKLWEYERTPEVRKKASEGVKKAYARGDLDGRRNAQLGWINGKFDGVNFKRGIGGYFVSQKIGKRFFFRSLLELKYLIMLETDDSIISYVYEPFRIHCDDGTIYTPDLLINDKIVVEIKSYNFVYKQGGKIQERFEYKVEQAKKYCLERDLEFMVVFDKDIGFDSETMKHYLRESDVVHKYKIEFLQPERVWS